MAGAFGAGVTAEELPNHNKKGFAAAPASVWDPAERLKEQDRDGVAAFRGGEPVHVAQRVHEA